MNRLCSFVVILLMTDSIFALITCPGIIVRSSSVKTLQLREDRCSKIDCFDRRQIIIPLLSFFLSPKKSLADDDTQSSIKAKALAKQLAAVQFTGLIDRATEQANLLAQRGDLAGAEKQWNAVIDAYDTNAGKVTLSPQAIYRLSKAFEFRADIRLGELPTCK